MVVRLSSNNDFGVFAVRKLRQGIKLGPYEGKLKRVESSKGYCWKLRDGFLIDDSDETESNYLRFVNCARNIHEQNLVAFQYRGDIYYRVCKDIKRDGELLVHYGESFETVSQYFQPGHEDIHDIYFCDFCCIGLSTEKFKKKHEKHCKFGKTQISFEWNDYNCKFCHCYLATSKYLKGHEKRCSFPHRIK